MKKKVIQVIVIVIAFGGSGVVLYNGFFKNNNQEALQNAQPVIIGANSLAADGQDLPAPATPISDPSSQNLLPFGEKLDYSILDKRHLQSSGYVPLPLNLSTDVGIPESNLVMPESDAQ